MTPTASQKHHEPTLEEIRARAVSCALVLFERSGDESYALWAKHQLEASLRAAAGQNMGQGAECHG